MRQRRRMLRRSVGVVAVLGMAALVLGGCSTTNDLLHGKQVDYQSAGSLPPLDIPPNLAAPDYSQRYAVSGTGSGTTFSSFQAQRKEMAARTGSAEVLPKVPHMHIVQAGTERWLVVSNETPTQLWPKIKEFWNSHGFVIKKEIPAAGIMQTGWAVKRAHISQGLIRSALSKLLGESYSTPRRDMFRTRLEHTLDGKGTEVFISHRGMQQIYIGSTDVEQPLDRTMWEPTPPDPGIEAEFLRLLMVSLGESEQRAKAMLAKATVQTPRAALSEVNGVDQLTIVEPFPNAWRRVGLALDRVGFTVEDQNREKGLYYVRYADPDAGQGRHHGSFLSKLAFWRSSKRTVQPQQYQVQVKQVGKESIVQVLDKNGVRTKSETARKILSLLHGQLM